MRFESKTALVALLLAVGCGAGSSPTGAGDDNQGTGGSSPGRGGTGGSKSGSGGSGNSANGGAGGSTSNTGGSSAIAGAGGAAGDPGGASDAASSEDMAEPTDVGSVTPPGDGGGPAIGPGDPTQGPAAEGTIKYSNDFEKGLNGMSLSPTDLPPERVAIVDDPTGKRGKVVSISWLDGDNFRTSAGNEPRSWLSSAKVYQITPGTKVSLAWGEMWTTANMNAFFAQVIGPGPVFEMRVRDDGTFNTLCNQCGGNADHFKIEPNRWYDFKVDMDWTTGGAVRFFVDGKMIREGKLGGVSANSHWDGGIYWARGSTKATRKIYISNLSIGER
jgi:hypothetical protein